MKKFTLFLLVGLFSITLCNAQSSSAEKREKERYEKEMAERKAKFINDIIVDLELDEFQQEIVRQKLHSYFDEKVKILRAGKVYYERNQEIEDLDATYFKDLQGVLPDKAIESIKKAVKGEKDKTKKKKKKNKRKKKD